MNYQVLCNELVRYPGQTDTEIVAALNKETVVSKMVEPGAFIGLAYDIGLYPKLTTIIYNSDAPAELRGLAQALLDIFKLPEISVTNPGSVAMLDALVSTGLITSDERSQFETLGIASRSSRASQLGLGTVTEQDIADARAWTEAQTERNAMLARLDSAYNQARWMVTNDNPLPDWLAVVAVFGAA